MSSVHTRVGMNNNVCVCLCMRAVQWSWTLICCSCWWTSCSASWLVESWDLPSSCAPTSSPRWSRGGSWLALLSQSARLQLEAWLPGNLWPLTWWTIDRCVIQSNVNTSSSVLIRPGTLLDFRSQDLAEQLTLMDSELFYKIEVQTPSSSPVYASPVCVSPVYVSPV